MVWAAVSSKEVVLLLLICCLVCFSLFVGVLCLSSFCCVLLCVLSRFAIILKRKRGLVALLLLSYRCLVAVSVLWLSLVVPWVGWRCDCCISWSYSLTFLSPVPVYPLFEFTLCQNLPNVCLLTAVKINLVSELTPCSN